VLRRTFLGRCLAALGFASLPHQAHTRFKVDTAGGHYFDWTKPPVGVPVREWPYTTDPLFKGKLTYGRHNHVFVNGGEVLFARRFLTGEYGWVEESAYVPVLGIEGWFIPKTQIVDTWDDDRVLSPAEERTVRWQVSRPKPGGGKLDRYREEFVYVLHLGRVEFRVDPVQRA
jgi:hypothetical protein